MEKNDLMKEARVQVNRGNRRSWRTLWRSQPDWDPVWYGVIVGYRRAMNEPSELIVADQTAYLKSKMHP